MAFTKTEFALESAQNTLAQFSSKLLYMYSLYMFITCVYVIEPPGSIVSSYLPSCFSADFEI